MPLSVASGKRDMVVFESETAPPGAETFKCYGHLLKEKTLDNILAIRTPGAAATLLTELPQTVDLLGTHLGRSLVKHFQVMIDL